MNIELEQENALLKATLREMLRIADESRKDGIHISPELALEGRLLKQYQNIEKKARVLAND